MANEWELILKLVKHFKTWGLWMTEKCFSTKSCFEKGICSEFTNLFICFVCKCISPSVFIYFTKFAWSYWRNISTCMSYLPRDYSTLICSIRNLDICFLRLREHISSEGQCLGERKNINILYRSRVLLVGVSWSYFYSRILCANAQWKSQRKMTASDNPAIVKLGKKIKRHEKKKLLIIIEKKPTKQ